MNCQSCGAELPDAALFCPKCGERFPQEGEAGDAATPRERFNTAAMSRREGTGTEIEEKLWEGTYSGKAMLGTWILGALASVGLGIGAAFFLPLAIGIPVIWLILGGALAYEKLSIHYELTTQRLIHKSGFFKRVSDRIEVIEIDDVSFEQGIVQRMMNVGTIRIQSDDRTHPELVLYGISDVKVVADLIDDVRRKERRRRGLHINSM